MGTLLDHEGMSEQGVEARSATAPAKVLLPALAK
jgi:hypothetical protein